MYSHRIFIIRIITDSWTSGKKSQVLNLPDLRIISSDITSFVTFEYSHHKFSDIWFSDKILLSFMVRFRPKLPHNTLDANHHPPPLN